MDGIYSQNACWGISGDTRTKYYELLLICIIMIVEFSIMYLILNALCITALRNSPSRVRWMYNQPGGVRITTKGGTYELTNEENARGD